MGSVNPRQIVENIECVLSGKEPAPLSAPVEAKNGSPTVQPQDNQLWKKLDTGPLRQMRQHQAVDQVPEEAPLRGVKKAFARFLRLVSAPQAVYNSHNIQAMEHVAADVDGMRSRLALVENRIEHGMREVFSRLDEMSQRQNAAIGELHAMRSDLGNVQEELLIYRGEFGKIHDAIVARAHQGDVTHIWNEIAVLREGIGERANQKDVEKLWTDMKSAFDALHQRASYNDVKLIWNEFKVIHQSLDSRKGTLNEAKFWEEIEKIYSSINERVHSKDGERLWAEVTLIHNGLAERGSQADVTKLFHEIQHIYKSLSDRGSQADVSKLFEEIQHLHKGLAERGSQADVTKLFEEIQHLHKGLAERGTQVDLSRLWVEVQSLYKAIEERASQTDIPRLWEEIKSIYGSIEDRSSQEDMERVWLEFGGIHENLKQRAYQSDVSKLWDDLKSAFDGLNHRASMADVTKLWSEVSSIHENLKERAYQKDIAKLYTDMQSAFKGINERAVQADVAKLWVEVSSLQTGLEARAQQADISKLWDQVISHQRAIEERAGQAALSQLWTELIQVNKSIEVQVQNLWQGIEERDRQLTQNTTATQHLHGQVGSVENAAKELRARMLMLQEQIALREEEASSARETYSAAVGNAAAAVPAEPAQVRSPAVVDPQLKKHLDLAYLRFQRQFRGEEDELRARQQQYIDLLKERFGESEEKPRVLDVACGDGIFVEMLAKEGWQALGVDINDAMVKQGLSRNLPIEQHDAMGFLDSAQAGTYDAITAFQFVEHLQPPDIMRLLRGAYKALRPHGLLIIETINPHTMKALHWYHLDLTHARLVFPEMLELLAETAGFHQTEWKGINPVAESERLTLDGTDAQRENVQKLNKFLFGQQDYYLVARRPGRAKKNG